MGVLPVSIGFKVFLPLLTKMLILNFSTGKMAVLRQAVFTVPRCAVVLDCLQTVVCKLRTPNLAFWGQFLKQQAIGV